ncbi:hypothetical protein OSB04_001747 [Centaurea solstitialis]|uniref:Uncharacterized protein n=1 Tax=Centaurea solstitialis TaxID=347529 RepID=A0AA38U252_9ASTR|nr:hypothetical protein OSB04_001747 [Centaurea solstitialis]
MRIFIKNAVDPALIPITDDVNEKANLFGDVDKVKMDEIQINTDDSDLEAKRKALLKKLRKENIAFEEKEDNSSFYVGKVFRARMIPTKYEYFIWWWAMSDFGHWCQYGVKWSFLPLDTLYLKRTLGQKFFHMKAFYGQEYGTRQDNGGTMENSITN